MKKFVFIFLVSCNACVNKNQDENLLSHSETEQFDSLNPKNQHLKTIALNAKKKQITPVFGYRFILTGDFDGDGKQEKLIEHFFSGIDHEETNKFYDGLTEYDQLVDLTMEKQPYSFVVSDNEHIDTLHISSGLQLLGIAYMKNEGDLNGDRTDEVSYVVNWADWSNMNTWHIMTYKNKKWKELYAFPMWDWQLPNLPKTVNKYGVFGLEQKIIITKEDSLSKLIEKEFLDFKGLVKKISRNKIEIIFQNEEAMLDTMIVDLRKPNPAR